MQQGWGKEQRGPSTSRNGPRCRSFRCARDDSVVGDDDVSLGMTMFLGRLDLASLRRAKLEY